MNSIAKKTIALCSTLLISITASIFASSPKSTVKITDKKSDLIPDWVVTETPKKEMVIAKQLKINDDKVIFYETTTIPKDKGKNKAKSIVETKIEEEILAYIGDIIFSQITKTSYNSSTESESISLEAVIAQKNLSNGKKPNLKTLTMIEDYWYSYEFKNPTTNKKESFISYHAVYTIDKSEIDSFKDDNVFNSVGKYPLHTANLESDGKDIKKVFD